MTEALDGCVREALAALCHALKVRGDGALGRWKLAGILVFFSVHESAYLGYIVPSGWRRVNTAHRLRCVVMR